MAFNQGCALADPGGRWCLTFALRRLENLNSFSHISYAGHPGFYKFKVLGSLQFSLEQKIVNGVLTCFYCLFYNC